MRIGTTPLNNKNMPFGYDFKLMQELGYYGIDFQEFVPGDNKLFDMNEEELKQYLLPIKNEANKYGLVIHQLHSYWICPPAEDRNEDTLFGQLYKYEKAIIGASILECPYVVVHARLPYLGVSEEDTEKTIEINVKFLKKLMPIAHKYNVTLCLENLPFASFGSCSIDSTIKIVDLVNDNHLGICLDTGHANCFKDDIYQDAIKIGKRLKALHIHDNIKVLCMDLHYMPLTGDLDWKGLMKGLKEIGFDGVFSSECNQEFKNMPFELQVEYQRMVAKVMDYVANKL